MSHDIQQLKNNKTLNDSASVNHTTAGSSSYSHDSTVPQDSNYEQVFALVEGALCDLGYDLVDLAIVRTKPASLMVTADLKQAPLPVGQAYDKNAAASSKGMSLDDCVAISQGLDPVLDTSSLIESLFPDGYELDVSSPGVDRVLKSDRDLTRFKGRDVRIKTYRSLTGLELCNEEYASIFPKQKNFLGILTHHDTAHMHLKVSLGLEKSKKPKKNSKSKKSEDSPHRFLEIKIPRPLIASARLEPSFDFGDDSTL